jgi:penicillin-binding protein 1A
LDGVELDVALLARSRAMLTRSMEETLVTAEREGPSRFARIARRTAAVALAGAIVAGIAGVITIVVLSRDLPEIRSLDDYRPKQATVVYGSGGEVVARFADERRTVVPYDQIPKLMVDAVIAAEDDQFFQHDGLDYIGIVRCMVKNAISGRKRCGGSTITQQTVKTFFLTPEKTYGRKLKEMILAKRVEDALEKDEILYLYLNQIFYGHRAYGVQEAARVYFGKDVRRLDVAEAALLAGLPQSPAKLDPYRYPDQALARRAYVLGRMRTLEKIDQATYDRAMAEGLDLDYSQSERDIDSNNHYAAHVKLLLEGLPSVGPAAVEIGGLEVYTGVHPAAQRAAEDALREGLRSLDKRQGWRGPLAHLEPNDASALAEALIARRDKMAAKTGTGAVTIVDLAKVRAGSTLEAIEEAARFPRFQLERTYGGIVVLVDDPGKEAVVSLGGPVRVHLPLRTGLAWARRHNLARETRRPRAPSEVLAVGDIVLVRPTAPRKDEADHYVGMLEQEPLVEGSAVVIDPATREVRALVGGYGIGAGTFNRALQARRQAGSTFKPFVYAAAFETGKYTPVSKCLDAPRVYRDPWTKRTWKPMNYGGEFHGEITLRTALTLSKNLCSVELIDRIGVPPVLDVAKRAGIESPLPRNLTLALGSGDVTPLEMVNAYATLATGGEVAAPIFVKKVLSAEGRVLHEARSEPTRAIRPEVTYLVTSLMQSVVEDGTAKAVTALERPVAGKTGTSNEARNAWFIGFLPDLVAGVWVGFDNNDPLGPNETGGRAAIPIWLDLMQDITKDAPVRDFIAPSGIVFAAVDPKTGKLATTEDAANEPFLAGTEPTDLAETVDPGPVPWPDYE